MTRNREVRVEKENGAQRSSKARSTIYRAGLGSTPSLSPHGGPAHPRGKVKLRETT